MFPLIGGIFTIPKLTKRNEGDHCDSKDGNITNAIISKITHDFITVVYKKGNEVKMNHPTFHKKFRITKKN